MSHFSLLVKISKKRLDLVDGDINAALSLTLEPYNESRTVEEYRRYERADDMLRMADHYKWPVEEGADWEDVSPGEIDDTHYSLPGNKAITRESLLKLITEHGVDWSGGELRFDEKEGPYSMSTYNLDARWDWWVIGGRWKGLLELKPGVEPVLGEDGLYRRAAQRRGESVPAIPTTRSDVARVCDLDIEKIKADAEVELCEMWEKYLIVRDCVSVPETKLSEGERKLLQPFGFLSTLFDMGIATREELGADENGKRQWGDIEIRDIPDFAAFRRDYGGAAGFSTWAVLDENGWHEKGKMLMFGAHDGEPEQLNDFENGYMQQHILNEDPETTLVVVDCHT
jgi:hypothetical protein